MSEKKVKVRHLKQRACVVNTRYGEVQIDETGGVTNLDDLPCSAKGLMELPNFVDAKLFSGTPEAAPVKQAREEAEAVEAAKKPEPTGPSDEEYGAVIAELVEGGAARTTEGYIQMDVLNAALRERDMSIISGTRRKDISDAWDKAD